MIYIRRVRKPKELKDKNKKYLKDVKDFLKNGNNESDIYKEVFKKNKHSYNHPNVTTALLKMSKSRCPFCCRRIYDSKVWNTKMGCTIEHIKVESKFPKLIIEWKNMLPCCGDCNNYRDDNDISSYIDPSKYKFIEKYTYYTFSGMVMSQKNFFNVSMEQMISKYGLNRDFLRFDRIMFMKQVLDKNFNNLMKLEGKRKTENPGIIFLDLFNQFDKNRKRRQKYGKFI